MGNFLRFLSIAFLLLAASPVSADDYRGNGAFAATYPRIGDAYRTPGMAAGGCSQATMFLARTSGLSTKETNAYTTLICGLVTDGNYSLLDVLYIFATNNTTTANLNLISTSYTGTTHGTLTFAADVGYTGDGSSGYIDTGFNPSTAGGNYALNSADIGAYVLNARVSPAYKVEIGGTDGTNYIYIDPYDAPTDTNYLALNDNGSDPGVVETSTQGSWLGSRTVSTGFNYYRNGSSIQTSTTASTSIPSINLFIFAQNTSGFSQHFSNDQLSATFAGGGLNSTKAGQVQSRINAYMTTMGINVY